MSDDSATPPAGSQAVAVGLIALGVLLVVFGLVFVRADPDAWRASPAAVTVAGLLFGVCGVLAGRWTAANEPLNDLLGATVLGGMAYLCLRVALYGAAANFHASIGGAGIAVTSRGSVGLARIAFGTSGAVLALIAIGVASRALRRIL